MPSPTSLLAIFETFLEGHLRQEVNGKRFQVGVVQVCASLIKGALSVHKEVGLRGRILVVIFYSLCADVQIWTLLSGIVSLERIYGITLFDH